MAVSVVAHLASDPAARIVDLRELGRDVAGLATAPLTTRILAENVVRAAYRQPTAVRAAAVDDAVETVAALVKGSAGGPPVEVAFRPGRLVMQDHSGIPVLADLAALRSLAERAGRDPGSVRPALPLDLVIDHSVEAFETGHPAAIERNMDREFAFNADRYRFLRWAQQAVAGLRVVPPGAGIVHQIHLEHLAQVVSRDSDGFVCPDTVLGTDSHTTMVNALGVLGWGVGGVEASLPLFGFPVSVRSHPVVAVVLTGAPRPGILATDIALSVTELLRRRGVVGTVCEFVGPGLAALSVADRATIANMAPEYGCLAALFPVDDAVLAYLAATGRPARHIRLVTEYLSRQDMLLDGSTPPVLSGYADVIPFDLGAVEGSAAGPRRPQDRQPFRRVPDTFRPLLADRATPDDDRHGRIVIAAITSCTNTANPRLVVTAALLARNAVARGLTTPEWTKTSFAPGSRRVTGYLAALGLLEPMAALGFGLVGYGCTTCIGNSGPVEEAARSWSDDGVVMAAVLSGNRNFEGRIHPAVAAAYLMSPPMVVAYALAGTVLVDIERDPLGHDATGRPVVLADIWPTEADVTASLTAADSAVDSAAGQEPADIFAGDGRWRALDAPSGPCYDWPADSTYLMPSPLVSSAPASGVRNLVDARVLVFAPDSTTTDHISPAGAIDVASEAGEFLIGLGIRPAEFNSYGCRRGNHEVLIRGTFANVRFRNRLAVGRTGGWTRMQPGGAETSIYRAAGEYRRTGTPTIVLAGRDYGMGSSRDWAARGPRLLGVKAVLATSFERIHRSNLVGVGIVPLEFLGADDPDSLGLTGTERYSIDGLADLTPRSEATVTAVDDERGTTKRWQMRVRVDTSAELSILRQDGFLGMLSRSAGTAAHQPEGAH